MGFFSKVLGGGKTSAMAQPSTVAIGSQDGVPKLNLDKEQSVKLLNLRKETVSTVCLKKSILSKTKARVGVAMDYSGSMGSLYRNGTVQETINRILPIALKFDDNGELDMWIFENSFKRLESVTVDNFYDYVKRDILDAGYRMGGTCYAPVMKDIMSKYMNDEPSDVPTYIIYITDGDNSDKAETERVIRESCKHNIFWQFVGIGDAGFPFLQKLDDLKGREIDNTDFFGIEDLSKISDEKLYNDLLNEYPGWESNVRKLGMIK